MSGAFLVGTAGAGVALEARVACASRSFLVLELTSRACDRSRDGMPPGGKARRSMAGQIKGWDVPSAMGEVRDEQGQAFVQVWFRCDATESPASQPCEPATPAFRKTGRRQRLRFAREAYLASHGAKRRGA
jgi:hypothetical protein